jgi:cytochrome b
MIRVWDPGVRVFHWGAVLLVAVAATSGFVLGRPWFGWHLAAGIGVAALLVWRLIWGGLGPAYARFAGFAFPPRAVLAHLRDLRAGRLHRHLGHNPAGALMVFALLAVLAALTVTGTLALGGMLKQGPARAFLSYAVGQQWRGVHKALAILLLGMIAAHLCGVALESWRGRENLVRAMLTGDKPAAPPGEAVRPARARPWAALGLLLIVVAGGTWATRALSARPGLGVPPAAVDPVVAEQCGACHLAFPPSLAPEATWRGILADLTHHFGADASLSPALAAHVGAWLEANAAERWDTLPSHLLRVPAADGSLRITDTPGWRRMHGHIPPAVFTARPIYRRSDCEACHADAASGGFAPQEIAVPEFDAAGRT